MTMQYDVKSSELAVTDEVLGRVRLKGVLLSFTTGGVIALSDGATGNTLFEMSLPKAAGALFIPVPGEGILFNTSIYAKTLTNATITVFYG